MSSAPPETDEFTPEQKKLLAKAYRLILSWPREKKTESHPCAAGSVTSPACTSNQGNKKPSKKKGD